MRMLEKKIKNNASGDILNGFQELDLILMGERAERTYKYVSTRNPDKIKKQLLKAEEYI